MEEKITITRDNGEQVQALAPVIVSASRATDIPAFYARWFVNRLKAGYCVWYNPFNGQPCFVSFKRTKAVVFWTKNPEPMLPYLHELDDMGIHYYFQMTLNDYDDEGFEPNVGKLEQRIRTFRRLSDMIGREKVIWRFDPLIMTSGLTPDKLLEKVERVGEQLKGYTDKLVFSFVDVRAYRKVQMNLVKETGLFTHEDVGTAEPTREDMDLIVSGLAGLRDRWASEGWRVSLATCGEKVDLERYGIEHNRCIDGELMKRLFADDRELVYYLNTGRLPEPSLFGDMPDTDGTARSAEQMKDKGQRLTCGCMLSKDIGMYNTCRHLCVYCYANSSKETVLANQRRHSDFSESIID